MKRVCLGKIVSAHGVKGLVKILPFGDDPRLIETLGPVFTTENRTDTLSITMKNSAGHKYWLAAIEGISERNAAEALRGTEIFIARERLPESNENEGYYYSDLIGMIALSEDGNTIGEVIAVKNFGAGDLVEIQPKGRNSYYLPFDKNFIQNVNLETQTLTAIPRGFDE